MARKARTKKEKTAATYSTARPQSSGSNSVRDKYRKAKPAGWRKSKSGKWYYENRRNRSDNLDEVDKNKIYAAFKASEKKAEEAKKAAKKAAATVKKVIKPKTTKTAKARKRNTKQSSLF